jgi:hypothetical protein
MLMIVNVNAQYSKVEIEKSIATEKKVDVNPIKSEILIQELSDNIDIKENKIKWNRKLINFDKKHKLPDRIKELVHKQTELKLKNKKDYYPDEHEVKSIQNSPSIGTNFEGNWFDGAIPPDNSMAISNGGYIVTVINSNIEYYNTSGTLIYTSSFDDFFNDATLTSMIYDPVVLYDSGSDRFFMVVLHGTSSSTSKVLACFSKTNNPSDGWWVYHLTGDPLSDLSWFDYPKIGVSSNEVYITGNLYFDAGDNNQSVIYQIDKFDGYAGNSLPWQYWYNISNEPFTMVPASYGHQGNYGPGIFLISTFGINDSNSTLRLFDITDDMFGSPQLDVYAISHNFTIGGNALQLGTNVVLDCGNPRGLSAFYLNGIVHFVFQSEFENAYNGLNYNRLTVSSLSNWNSKFGLDGYDYTYPSVASFSSIPTDKTVLICFLRSGSSIYPQTRVVSCDNSGNWTGSSLVKSGETYVDYLSSSGVSRWGDYSGISRKQNASSPEVWLSGCFGKYRNGQHTYDTWVAQITGITVGIEEQDVPEAEKFSVFPNPVYDIFKVNFFLENDSPTEIVLNDISGKTIKILFKDKAKKGNNQYSFNKGALTSGIYLLTVSSNSKIMKSEKIIIK